MIIDNYRDFQNYLFFGSWKKTVLKIKISVTELMIVDLSFNNVHEYFLRQYTRL